MYLDYIETTADDFMDQCTWDEVIKEKTRQPVAPNGKCNFDANQTQKIFDFAWFENPRRPIEISIWDEAAKKKMREPVLGNGYHNLPDAIVRNLIEFASLY
jgi:hypothetical protein